MSLIRGLLYWLFAVLGAASALPAFALEKTHLEIGEVLQMRDYLVPPDHKSHAVLQADGNLCVYFGDKPAKDPGQSQSLWCSGSARNTSSYYAQLRPDANLCIYRGVVPPADGREGSSIWCWGYKTHVGGRYVLRVEGAALCAYEFFAFSANTTPRPPRLLWASRKLNKLSGFIAR